MSTTTVTPAPPIAEAVLPAPRASTCRALAIVEGRRLILHPLFVLGLVVSLLFTIIASRDGGGGALSALVGGSFMFFGVGLWTFVVASLNTSRARRDGVADVYAATPVCATVRTMAALLSLAWAGLAGAVLIGAAAAVLAGPDGALVVDGASYGLRPLELAQGPLYLVVLGAFGVLLGTYTRRVYAALIGALVLFMPPSAWLPWLVYGPDAPAGVWDDWLRGASVAWHLVGLAGLAALAAAGALARHDRRPRVALLAVAGLAAAVAGIALGWPPGM